MTENDKQHLYFIAIMLPDDISTKVISVQQEIAERFNSRKALRNLPHITLKAPFNLPAMAPENILGWFSELQIELPPFQLQLQNFGAFKNHEHPVIFINPVENAALLSLQKSVVRQFYQTFDRAGVNATDFSFNPHITLAYRDLKPDMFEAAWTEFQNRKFSADFNIDRIELLKHDGKGWQGISHRHLK